MKQSPDHVSDAEEPAPARIVPKPRLGKAAVAAEEREQSLVSTTIDTDSTAAGANATTRPSKRRPRFLADIVPPFVVFFLFLAAWSLFRTYVLDEFKRRLLPQPWSVVAHGFTEKGTPKNPGELLNALGLTARVSVMGLAIAIVLGIAVAIVMSQAKWAENSLYPYAVALQTIPIIAVAPVIAAIFGYGVGPRVLVCVIISIVPIMLNTLFGLKSADQGQHDLLTLHGASRWTRLRKLQLPAALPAMFEGFRISAGLAVIGAIVGEFFFQQGPRGLGNLVGLYRQRSWYPQLYANLILCCALGLAVFLLFTVLRGAVIGKWHQDTTR